MQTIKNSRRQSGAALIVGLLLLVVITVLAISGMNTATTELALARNHQTYENAFQAAETGIDTALAQPTFDANNPVDLTPTATSHEVINVAIRFEDTTLVPDRAFSLGAGSGIAAYHFQATSQARYRVVPGVDTDERDSTATHTQAFYIVGPDSPTL